MSQITMRISYEWDLEEIDEFGDIVDHNHSDKCPGIPTTSNVELVLVRDEFEGLSGDDFNDSATLKDRDWAYVKDDALPETFPNGYRVPKRFHEELRKIKWINDNH